MKIKMIVLLSACVVCFAMLAYAGITISTVSQAAGSIQESSYTFSDTSAHALPASAVCKRIKLIAPVSSGGVGSNTAAVFYGDASGQHDWVATDGSRDDFVHVDDASKVYVKGASGDVIYYRIEF